MLFNTDDLNTDYNTRNTLNLLESMYRIDRVWAKHTPASVPLMESKEYGAFIARYSDLMKLSEEYDASIQECLDAVIYENHLRPNEVIVSLEEWRPYVDPLILHRFSNNYVLVPEINTPAYRLCEICMESFLETGDYTWLDFYVECPNFLTESKASKARKRAAMQAQGLDPKGIGNPQQMQSKLEELRSKKEKYEAIANNQNLSPEDRQSATNMIIQIDKTMMSVENNLNKVQNIQKERKSNTAKSEEEIIASMTPEQKKLYLQQKHGTKISSNTPTSNVSSDNGPSWFAQKWTALKNWWNNAGQADSNGNVGFFSNLASKFKNFIGWGNNNQNNNTTNTNQTNNQAAQPAEKAQDQTNKAAEEAAKKAEAEKKQAEETAKQKEAKAAEQSNNDQKQKENQTAPATAPATPTDNKPAATA